jgi:hypothetical protein
MRSKKARRQDPEPRYRFPLPVALYPLAGLPPPDQLSAKSTQPVKKRRRREPKEVRSFLVTTNLGYVFRRYKPFIQPHWLSMIHKRRARQAIFRVERWQRLETWLEWVRIEERMMRSLGIDDTGWGKLGVLAAKGTLLIFIGIIGY